MDATNRCDRCQAAALVSVLMPTGGLLLFCAHHFSKHKIVLADQGGLVIEDDREGVSV